MDRSVRTHPPPSPPRPDPLVVVVVVVVVQESHTSYRTVNHCRIVHSRLRPHGDPVNGLDPHAQDMIEQPAGHAEIPDSCLQGLGTVDDRQVGQAFRPVDGQFLAESGRHGSRRHEVVHESGEVTGGDVQSAGEQPVRWWPWGIPGRTVGVLGRAPPSGMITSST